jgi:hypothetical protein
MYNDTIVQDGPKVNITSHFLIYLQDET